MIDGGIYCMTFVPQIVMEFSNCLLLTNLSLYFCLTLIQCIQINTCITVKDLTWVMQLNFKHLTVHCVIGKRRNNADLTAFDSTHLLLIQTISGVL